MNTVLENAPTCRVCGQPMQFLGLGEGFVGDRWYCYKDDQVWLADEQKWEERIVSESQAEQPQTVKYCKKCGNMLELEDEFCDKCGSGQKKIVVTAFADGQQKLFLNKPGLWYLVHGECGMKYVKLKKQEEDWLNLQAEKRREL